MPKWYSCPNRTLAWIFVTYFENKFWKEHLRNVMTLALTEGIAIWYIEIYPRFIFADAGTWHLDPDTWKPWTCKPGTWNLTSGTWHLRFHPGTWHLEPGTWHLEPGTWHLRFEPAGEWAITMCPVSLCCYSFLYRTSLIEHLTLTLLKGKNSVLLNSVQEFIEIEAKLRLTYFICLNNKLICTRSIVTY